MASLHPENPHPDEIHRSQRAAWLRAAILGANDGIVSVSSLMLGVLTAQANDDAIIIAGFSGLAAGALSMAVGEYVSVASQRDSERADIEIERRSQKNNPKEELAELAEIYEYRGLESELAMKVAQQLHKKDPVVAHVRDELGIDNDDLANPLQAAAASAVSFSLGATVPVVTTLVFGSKSDPWPIVIASLVTLGISGGIGAIIGGGNRLLAAARVLIGGGIAMAITALVGHLISTGV